MDPREPQPLEFEPFIEEDSPPTLFVRLRKDGTDNVLLVGAVVGAGVGVGISVGVGVAVDVGVGAGSTV